MGCRFMAHFKIELKDEKIKTHSRFADYKLLVSEYSGPKNHQSPKV